MLRSALIVLLFSALVASLDPGYFNNNGSALHNDTVNASKGEASAYQEKQFNKHVVKTVRYLLGRLIGGQSIVCTSLTDGSKITLEGTPAGKFQLFLLPSTCCSFSL